jgi:two-component system, NtrC family, sensor histidine kinase PilS
LNLHMPAHPAGAMQGDSEVERDLLFGRLQRLMFVRILLVTAVFGLILVLRSQGHAGTARPLATLYPVFLAFYALSALYALVARRMPNLELFILLQFAADATCISLLLLFTGGADSVFTLVYVFPILGASYLRMTTGGLVVATFDAVGYIACLLLAGAGYGQMVGDGGVFGTPAAPIEGVRTYTTVAFHIVSFYLVAFLSGSLARKQAETGRALAETASSLHRLQNMHGRIVQNIDAGLLTVDPSARITSFNRAGEDITRWRASEVIGMPLETVFKGMSRLLDATTDSASSLPPGPSLERWMTRKDGKRVFLRVSASALRTADGRMDGQILVFEDRTRLLMMTEQLEREERLAAVGRLSAAIAHEIRNPLASITGSVQVLRGDLDLSPEDDELLGIVEREADRLGHLVTDFLALTKEEKPQLVEGSVGPLVQETLALLRNKGIAAGVEIEADLAYDPPVHLDSHRMRQVFWNLFNNACQVMTGGGALRVGTERVTADDLGADSLEESVGDWARLGGGVSGGGAPLRPGEGALRIVVEDDGPGISDDALAHIFDPFYTTRSGGTGLGLAIVARIVRSHRGVITVQSRLGEGTRFAIWLPIEPPVDAEDEVDEVNEALITDKHRASGVL